MSKITPHLNDVDGQLIAEYENHDGSLYLMVDVDREDFNDFAEVKTKHGFVTRDADGSVRAEYCDWFDAAEGLREDYAKSLPAYAAAVRLTSATIKRMEVPPLKETA